MQHINTVQMWMPFDVDVLIDTGRRKHNDLEFPPRKGWFCLIGFVFFEQLKMLVPYFAYHYRVTEGLPLPL